MKSWGRSVCAVLLVGSVASFGAVGPAHAAPAPASIQPVSELAASELVAAQQGGCFVERCAPGEAGPELEDLFTYIWQIPDGILRQGDAATHEWIRNNPRGSNAQLASATTTESDPLACVASIGAILVGVLVPAAKLLKIRQLIRDLGGVASSVRLLVGAGNAAEKTEALATALGFLVAELVGIRGVRDNCFS